MARVIDYIDLVSKRGNSHPVYHPIVTYEAPPTYADAPTPTILNHGP